MKLLEGDYFIFHDLINSQTLMIKIQSRYYGKFSIMVKRKKGKIQLLFLGFIKNINKYKLYKNLRTQKAFVPEDWLNFKDYFNSISLSIKSLMVNDKFYIQSKIKNTYHKKINKSR